MDGGKDLQNEWMVAESISSKSDLDGDGAIISRTPWGVRDAPWGCEMHPGGARYWTGAGSWQYSLILTGVMMILTSARMLLANTCEPTTSIPKTMTAHTSTYLRRVWWLVITAASTHLCQSTPPIRAKHVSTVCRRRQIVGGINNRPSVFGEQREERAKRR